MDPSIVDYLNTKGQASDFNSRSTLAKNNGITNYTGTADQNTQLLSYLRSGSNVQKPTPPTPTPQTTFNADDLSKPTTPLVVPPTPVDTSNPTSAIQGAVDFAKTNVDTTTAADTSLRSDQSGILDRIKTLMGLDTGKSADTQQLYNEKGIPQMQQDIQETTAQIANLDALTKNIPTDAQNLASGRGITAQGLQTSTINPELRTAAAQANLLQAQLAARQGKLTLAQNLIDKSISFKYDPIEQELGYKLKLLDINKDQLSAADQKQATAQQQYLTTQLQQVQIAKDTAAQIGGVYTDAAQGGAPNSVLAQVQKAMEDGDIQAAYNAAGQYLQKNKYQFIQTYNPTTGMPVFIRANTITGQLGGGTSGGIASNVGSLPGGGTSGAVTGGGTNTPASGANPQGASYEQYGLLSKTDFNPTSYEDKNALAYLQTYLNGTIPTARSLGISTAKGGGVMFTNASQRARDLYFKATGQPLPDNQILAANKQLIEGNNKLANNLAVQESTIKKNFGLNLDNLKANNLNTSFPIINSIFNAIDSALGQPGTAQYNLQNATLQQEAGNLMAVKNAAGTTVYDKMVGAGLIPKNASQEVQVTLMKTLLNEALNAKSSISDVNAGLYSQIDPLQLNPNNPARTSQQNQTTGGSASANNNPLGI